MSNGCQRFVMVVLPVCSCSRSLAMSGQREELFSNIVLTGGNTLFPGLAARLAKELEALKPSESWQVEVVAPDWRTLGSSSNPSRVAEPDLET